MSNKKAEINCRHCNSTLILGSNWSTVHKNNWSYICNECCNRLERERRKYLKDRAFSILGNRCNNPFNHDHPEWCNDIRILQIDHIVPCGKLGRTYNNISLYKMVIENPKDYQLLCPNCNWLKRIINGEDNRLKVK